KAESRSSQHRWSYAIGQLDPKRIRRLFGRTAMGRGARIFLGPDRDLRLYSGHQRTHVFGAKRAKRRQRLLELRGKGGAQLRQNGSFTRALFQKGGTRTELADFRATAK